MLKLKLLIDLVTAGSVFVLAMPSVQAEVKPTSESTGIVTQVQTIKDMLSPATSIREWLAQETTSPNLVQITGVRLNPTVDGLDVILATSAGPLSLPITSSNQTSLSVDITNAVLALPEGKEFRVENPTDGVATVSVSQQDVTTVRITITGVDGAPMVAVQLGDCPAASPCDRGLILSLTLAEIEIVVTAEKRPENPQNVPISLTVLTQQQLEDADINSVREVAAQTPNFFSSVGDRSFNFQTIRGLGNSNYLSRDAISFYLDDVPYENIHQFLPGELFDLERVEVLRGPQGTLYGRNSQAGVVNVISRAPTNSPEVRTGGGYGNVNQQQAYLSWSDAIVKDKLAFRLGGAYNARDGFTRNVLLNEDANPQDSLFGRSSILWTPTKEWTISFNANLGRNNDGDNTFVPINQLNPFRSASNIPGSLNVDLNTQSLRVAYAGKAVNVTAITARNQTNLYYTQDTDYTPLDLLRSAADIPSTIWSQEIRVQSPDTAERWRWLVGGYYQSRSLDLLLSTEYTPLVASLGFPVGIDRTDARFDQRTYAVFGQVDFKPLTALTLTAGLRYERFREQLNQTSSFDNPDLGTIPTGLTLRNSVINGDVLLPRLAIQYQVNPAVMVYGSVARGYKPGTQNFSADSLATLFVNPEKMWSYEVGVKSTWLNNRLTANLAVFWSNVDDYQILLIDNAGLSTFIANGGVETNGVEVELNAQVIKGFNVIAGFGYTNARFTNYTNPFTGQSFNGNRLTYAPEYTFNIGLQYRSRKGLFARLDLQGLGTYFFDDANTLKQPPFTLVNARIGYEWRNLGFYLFANNLLNKQYITTAFAGFFDNLASYGDRRTFGFQIRSTF